MTHAEQNENPATLKELDRAYKGGILAYEEGHASGASCATAREYLNDQLRQARLAGWSDASKTARSRRLRDAYFSEYTHTHTQTQTGA